jgi:hypothetical protein
LNGSLITVYLIVGSDVDQRDTTVLDPQDEYDAKVIVQTRRMKSLEIPGRGCRWREG